MRSIIILCDYVSLCPFHLQEKIQRGQEVDSLRKQIEREYLGKVKLEDQIMEVIRNQLTFDKAAQYTDRMTRKSRQLTKDLVRIT